MMIQRKELMTQIVKAKENFKLSSVIIQAQNDDGPLKWANGPYPIQINANFQILMDHLKFLRAPKNP